MEWHTNVGPDTFFTLPHLLLYSGTAVAGLTSLVVVLSTTAADRAGRVVDPIVAGRVVDPIVGGRAVAVLGRTFAAPVGYLVAGTGAAVFLVYGLWDQWWHGLYGFDAMVASPPHIGLLLSIMITTVGFTMVTVTGLDEVEADPVDLVAAGGALMAVVVLLCAILLGRGGALGLAVAGLGTVQTAVLFGTGWPAAGTVVATGLVGMASGALGGFLGVRFGAMLRQLAPVR
ncbi:hypothetical protein [Umezawaea tangerina]|uniref:Uncharacterized protein n=1 Tax=Umezawaea tangerina TaxID=84725 RepID=A0A2T0SQI6_9PSEU|nr:hypothetical protein [Umezawaea tangerina]PRY35666.1 hypothetical protein CLV43_11393 [Umezawaea tangerina]